MSKSFSIDDSKKVNYEAGHAAGLEEGKAELDKIAKAEYARGYTQGWNDAENKGYHKRQVNGVELGREQERELAKAVQHLGSTSAFHCSRYRKNGCTS